MHSRKWLQEELALHRKITDHCWKSRNPFSHSCVEYMTTAQDLFEVSRSKEDLAVWKKTVDRAEEYVKTKYAKYYAVVKRIRHPEVQVTGDIKKDEDHAKTTEHMEYIANQRELIMKREDHLKDLEWQRLTAIVGASKVDYEKTQAKAELKIWKASLGIAKQFLKDNKRDKNFIGMQIDDYNAAENEYNKQHSCISHCFSFWRPNPSINGPEKNEEKQGNDNRSRAPYLRLRG